MHEKKPNSMMGRTQLQELRALCESHPRIFNMKLSPSRDELYAFSERFHSMSFVKGLYDFGELDDAIALLEEGTEKATRNVPGFPERPEVLTKEYQDALDAFRDQKKFEREIRFVRRLSDLIGSCDEGPDHYLNKGQLQKRSTAAKALKRAHLALSDLMRDPYFRESLSALEVQADAMHLRQLLAESPRWIRQSAPKLPFTRARDEVNTRARHLVNRLVDASCRIYGWCDRHVVNHLTSYHWLEFAGECPDLDRTIDETMDRKVARLELREDSDDIVPIDLAEDEWLPAENYHPPWLDA